MKKIIIVCFAIFVFILASGCAGKKTVNAPLAQTSAPTIVIIGGAHSTIAQMELLRGTFPGSVVIVPEKYYPLWRGADTVLQQIKDKGVQGKLILIGHSWGGLLAREIDAENPGLIKAVVTIATPCGNFRFTPEVVSDLALRPRDSESKTPLYIIGGRTSAPKRWWMSTDESDGVVDIASIMATGERAVTEAAIFTGEHSELLQNPAIAAQIQKWLTQPVLKSPDVSMASTTQAPLISNRKKVLLQWALMTGFFHILLADLAHESRAGDGLEHI